MESWQGGGESTGEGGELAGNVYVMNLFLTQNHCQQFLMAAQYLVCTD